MKIEELVSLVTTDFLNEIISETHSGATLTLLKSKPAEFPFLEEGASNNALFLELTITSHPENHLPNQLVLKAANNTAGTAEREILFFSLLAEQSPVSQVVQCYGTKWLEDENIGLMLLERVGGDAIAYEGPLKAHLPRYKIAIRGLANLHALWWNHPRLGTEDLTTHWTPELVTSSVSLAIDGLRALSQTGAGQALQAKKIENILSITEHVLLAHAQGDRPKCLNHGDAALWNFVMDSSNKSLAKMVDFQMWCVNPPAWDVAYMMILLWPTEFRRSFGDEMITAYLDELRVGGISYTMEELSEDMRVCIVGLTTQVLAYYNLGIWDHDVASARLGWLMLAFDEYGCSHLLDRSREHPLL
jgi:aminoglycoside phosphotransferase (APT) family kinase protein